MLTPIAPRPPLFAVPAGDFDRNYSGTQSLLMCLSEDFSVSASVFTDEDRSGWYRQLPFDCHPFPYRDSWWNRGCLKLMSKFFWGIIFFKMLQAPYVLITEGRYLSAAALAKRLRGRRMVLVQYCQELALPEEYPGLYKQLKAQKRHARTPDVVIDVDAGRAGVRAAYYGLRKRPYVLRNTFPFAQMPPRDRPGTLWKEAQVAPPPGGMPVVVHAGGIGPEKPFQRILEMIAGVNRPVFLLAFCMVQEPVLEQLRGQAAEMLPPGSYAICPAIPRAHLRACLWEADVGVVEYAFSVEPTVNQRYCAPTKLYEFMACGLAVLGTNNDSLRDVIEREGIGLCAHGDSPTDLARALEDMLQQGVSGMKHRSAAAFEERYAYETACAAEVHRIAAEMKRLYNT